MARWLQALEEDIFHAPGSFFPLWRTRASEMAPTAALASFKVDVVEDSKHFVVKADLPGVTKEDIQVKMEGDNLVISAERREEKQQKEETRHISEVTYGKIYRSFRMVGGQLGRDQS